MLKWTRSCTSRTERSFRTVALSEPLVGRATPVPGSPSVRHSPFLSTLLFSVARLYPAVSTATAIIMSYSRFKIAARLRPALPSEQHDSALRVVHSQSGPAIHVDNPRDPTQTFKYPYVLAHVCLARPNFP